METVKRSRRTENEHDLNNILNNTTNEISAGDCKNFYRLMF